MICYRRWINIFDLIQMKIVIKAEDGTLWVKDHEDTGVSLTPFNLVLPNSKLIHAGPTCGKTTLIKSYAKMKFWDTDNDLFSLCPDWTKLSLYSRKNPTLVEQEFVNVVMRGVGLFCKNRISDPLIDVIFTNQWSNLFRSCAGLEAKLPLSFFRYDSNEIVDFCKARAPESKMNLHTAKHWVDSYIKHSSSVFDDAYLLGKGVFLGEVIKFKK